MLDLIADIRAQPQALLDNAAVIERAFRDMPGMVGGADALIITGMATSLWAWHSAALLLQDPRQRVVVTDSSEYLRYGRAATDAMPLVVTSRSGESAEIVMLMESLRKERMTVALTASRDSTLARMATHLLPFEADEAAFYNTKSYTLTLCLALASAAGLAGRDDLAPSSWLGRVSDLMAAVVDRPQDAFVPAAQVLARSRVALVTGRGHLIGVAQQAALDLQEGMKIAALPTPGGLLRHGPMELVRLPDSAVLFLIPDDHMAGVMTRAVRDLLDCGATVAAVAAEGVDLPGSVPVVRVPRTEAELAPMLFSAALHKLNVSVGTALGLSSIRPTLIPKTTRVE